MIDKISESILKQFHFEEEDEDCVVIDIPLQYGDGDGIRFYMRRDDKGYYIEDCDTIWRYDCKGLKDYKKIEHFVTAVKAEYRDGAITVRVNNEDFGEAVFHLAHIALWIDCLEE